MGQLYSTIEDLGYGDVYTFHKPGSKGNYYENSFYGDYYKLDVAGVDGKDSISDANGVLKEAIDRAARLYNADETFFLVNGTNSGILAALCATVKRGGKLLAMRESDLTLYEAANFLDLDIKIVSPEIERALGMPLGLTVEDVEAALEKEGSVDAVFVTSPTLEGISSEIDDIADLLHEKRIPLIVDASHGAHFGMAEFLPVNAVECGADIVIHALYNSLPCPIQTGLIHVNGSIVNIDEIKKYLKLFQATEPSYILMAGIDECIDYLSGKRVDWKNFYEKRQSLSQKIGALKNIGVLDAFTVGRFGTPEIGKIICYPKTGSMDGKQLSNKLRKEYHLKSLLAMPSYLVLTITICDSDEGYNRLAEALTKIDDEIELRKSNSQGRDVGSLEALFGVKNAAKTEYDDQRITELEYTISDALSKRSEAVPLNMIEGRISGEFVVNRDRREPILIPGERITKQRVKELRDLMSHKIEIDGIMVDRIQVLVEDKKKQES